MRKTSIMLSALIAFSACDNSNMENMLDTLQQGPVQDGVIMTIPDFVFEEESSTRTDLTDTDNGMSFVWTENDKVNVASKSGASVSKGVFSVKEIGANAKIAAFDGGGFALSANTNYYAFAPYNGDSSNPLMTLSFDGKTQSANANYSHLSAYDYMIAQATTDAEANAVFNFSHLGAVLKFKITVPNADTFTKATFTSTGAKFTTSGTVDYTSASAITPKVQSLEFSMALNNISVPANGELTLYSFVSPLDLSGSAVNIKLTNSKGEEYLGSVAGKNMQAGNAYGYIASVDVPAPYITFSSSDNTQTFMLSKSTTDTSLDGKLQYSVGGSSWTTLTIGQAVAFGGDKRDLRLRGKSNIGTNGFSVKFGQNTSVACSGDIRTLVDYANYETTDCSQAVFRSLFSGCTQLISAPDLPAITLAGGSYYRMFKGCTSLTSAPDLPATNIAGSCYEEMFYGCTSLVNVPALLPASTLYNNCYYSMFEGCTSLTTAPNIATITAFSNNNASEVFESMFYGCTSLTKAPDELRLDLKVPTQTGSLYWAMFSNCSSLTSAPVIITSNNTVVNYTTMFAGCSKLNYVKILDENIFEKSQNGNSDGWLLNVSPTGTIVISINNRYYDPDNFVYGPNTIPKGWTVKFESPAGIITDMEGDGDW